MPQRNAISQCLVSASSVLEGREWGLGAGNPTYSEEALAVRTWRPHLWTCVQGRDPGGSLDARGQKANVQVPARDPAVHLGSVETNQDMPEDCGDKSDLQEHILG